MKILVCIKQVPDTTAKLNIAPDGSGISEQGFKWVMNPYDEFAVEEALQLKKANAGSEINVVTLGPKKRVVDSLRTALALGCDTASLIDAPGNCDSVTTGKALAAYAEKEGPFDAIFTGKMAIDDSQSAVTQIIAQSAGITHANFVSSYENKGETIEIERDIEGGSKEVSSLPARSVIGANKGLNTPKYASLPGIMKAKKKPVSEFNLADLGLNEADIKVKFSNYRLPAERPEVKFLSGEGDQQASELVKLLREEAKVI
ncbi:MAG: electron transfer flavoprotein beta subunit/FixA family protein [Bdellovibrionales bacterium]